MLEAVLFDMDGVLINSEIIFYEADKILLEELGHTMTKEYYSQFVGTTAGYMWKRFVADFNLEKTEKELEERGREIVDMLLEKYGGFPEVPFVCDFVKKLSEKYTLVVASSSSMNSIMANVNRLGIASFFKGYVSGNDFSESKPAPDIFLGAARLAGVSPKKCLVIEDSRNGVKAAKAAGMVCIGYENPNSVMQKLNEADYVITDFCGLDCSFTDMVYCHSVNEPWNVLNTNRLSLWEMDDNELEIFYDLISKEDSAVISSSTKEMQEATLLNPAYMKAYTENMYKFYGYGIWAVKQKDSMETVGFAGVDKNGYLSYIIKNTQRRKGYCSEALCGIITYLFNDTEIEDVYAQIDENNLASIKVIKKLGFVKETEKGKIIWKITKKNFI